MEDMNVACRLTRSSTHTLCVSVLCLPVLPASSVQYVNLAVMPFPVVCRSMYFHVHIISILVAVALNPEHKRRKASSSSSSSSMCPLQCQPVHSNNNDKLA